MIEKFKSYFGDANVMLLCKSAGHGVEGDLNSATYDQKIDFVHRTITRMINLFIDAIIVFYGLEDQIRGEKDLRRELLFNLIANFVLEGELYLLVHNLISISRESELKQMRILMGNQEFLQTTLCTEKLSITEPFQFKPEFRSSFPVQADCSEEPYTPTLPFDSTIKSF